jgi:hypothetical protein
MFSERYFYSSGLKLAGGLPHFFDVDEADYSVEEVFDEFLLIKTLFQIFVLPCLTKKSGTRKRFEWSAS